ncbi:hypothetical protein L6452_18386 [Arctium lappa]|uniref:Uncharacterized protein n=1 Tax=Arctium lappa TaxID=4217 RepID=A0ACB9C5W8_ARCLA|nr:hypothetical protein L6452_18386 [Arctium lappa]
MMSMVCNSKASNLLETIDDAQIMEDVYDRDKVDKAVVVGDKRRWESNPRPPKRPRPFNGRRCFDNCQEARWCPRCRSKHHDNCNSNPTSCAKCGKSDHATKDCPIKGVVCFECKMLGHFRKDCPKWKTRSAPEKKENPPRVLGRSFQMTVDEAKASTDVVSGTFLLNFVPARVLLDSVVEVANGSHVLICDVLRECTLEIEGKEFLIDLMPMVIGGFDVAVGMDWLVNNHAEIVCSKKLI